MITMAMKKKRKGKSRFCAFCRVACLQFEGFCTYFCGFISMDDLILIEIK